MQKVFGILVSLGFIVACSSVGRGGKATGSEAGACYPNNTCNKGLQCLSDLCVNPNPAQDVSAGTDLVSGPHEVFAVTDPGSCVPSCGSRQCGSDGCGEACGTCGYGKDCLDGQCVCVPRDHQDCCGDAACWVDSCGARGDVIMTCSLGCVDGECVTCQPECSQKTCGDDGCGGTCGTCGKGQVCSQMAASGEWRCKSTACTLNPEQSSGGTPVPCGLGKDGADCGTCGAGYTCQNGDLKQGGVCIKEPYSDCGNWVHHAEGHSEHSSEPYCCRTDSTLQVIAQWPDGSKGCCSFLYPWPCDVEGQRKCCSWPGEASDIDDPGDLNNIASCTCK